MSGALQIFIFRWHFVVCPKLRHIAGIKLAGKYAHSRIEIRTRVESTRDCKDVATLKSIHRNVIFHEILRLSRCIDIYCDWIRNAVLPWTRGNDRCCADWQMHASSALKVLLASNFTCFPFECCLLRQRRHVSSSLRSSFYESCPVKLFIVPSIVGYAFSRGLNRCPYL